MINENQVEQIIFEAIDKINLQLTDDQKLLKTEDTILLGDDGTLDSLGFINLVVTIEQKLEEDFELSLNLTDENTFVQEGNPFESVKVLTGYILEQADKTD